MSIQSLFLARAYSAARSRPSRLPGVCGLRGSARVRLGLLAIGSPGQQPVRTKAESSPTPRNRNDHHADPGIPPWQLDDRARNWTKFPGWAECFAAGALHCCSGSARPFRTTLAAIEAADGEQYVTAVSQSWSTDPERAGKVLAIYDAHADALQQTQEVV